MPDGEDSFKTIPGAILSIVVFVIVFFYAGFKVQAVAERSDYNINVQKDEYFFTKNDDFTYDNGFAIAARLSEADINLEIKEDKTFGMIKFYEKTWNLNSEDKEDAGRVKMKEITSRPCNCFEFLQIVDPDMETVFYPL